MFRKKWSKLLSSWWPFKGQCHWWFWAPAPATSSLDLAGPSAADVASGSWMPDQEASMVQTGFLSIDMLYMKKKNNMFVFIAVIAIIIIIIVIVIIIIVNIVQYYHYCDYHYNYSGRYHYCYYHYCYYCYASLSIMLLLLSVLLCIMTIITIKYIHIYSYRMI